MIDVDEIPLVEYQIPYRPEYVRCFDPSGNEAPVGAWGRDMPGYRFHLSDEALELLVEQGGRRSAGMLQRLEVVWDATSPDPATIKVTQPAFPVGLEVSVDRPPRRLWREAWLELREKLAPFTSKKWLDENVRFERGS